LFRLHAEMPRETHINPALLVANTRILFNPKRGDIKVPPAAWAVPAVPDNASKLTKRSTDHSIITPLYDRFNRASEVLASQWC